MSGGKHLHTMLGETTPGAFANLIGEVLYDCENAIKGSNGTKGRTYVIELQACRAWLEKLALDQLATEHPWARELVEKLSARCRLCEKTPCACCACGCPESQRKGHWCARVEGNVDW